MPLYNPPGAAAHPNLATHDGLGLATDAELTAHDHDADYEAAGGIATHSADSTAVHGIVDTAVLATDAEVATAVSDHEGAANPHPTYETAAEVLAQIGTHEGLANPHPGYLTPAEGDAAYDALGAAAAAAAASQPLDSDLTAIAALTTTAYGRAFLALADAAAGRTALALGTAAVAATGDFDAAGAAAAAEAASQPLDSDLTAIAALTTTAFGRGLLELADAAALAALHTHAGGLTLTPLVQDLGAGRNSGTFDITGLSGLTADKPVLVTQTPALIASKGDARDEMEFDAIQAAGYVVDATTIRVHWNAPGVVVGDYAFGYTVSG